MSQSMTFGTIVPELHTVFSGSVVLCSHAAKIS